MRWMRSWGEGPTVCSGCGTEMLTAVGGGRYPPTRCSSVHSSPTDNRRELIAWRCILVTRRCQSQLSFYFPSTEILLSGGGLKNEKYNFSLLLADFSSERFMKQTFWFCFVFVSTENGNHTISELLIKEFYREKWGFTVVCLYVYWN